MNMLTREQVLGNQEYIERHIGYLSSPDTLMLQAIVDTDAALRAELARVRNELQSLINSIDDEHPEDLPAEIFKAARHAQAALTERGGQEP